MSADELFPAESVAMDSPRLAWLKKHGLELDLSEPPLDLWACYEPTHGGFSGIGDTPDEACADYAQRAKIKLWNEEDAQ